jgi:5-formyltetrahydrofolate cyclo-ligase
MDKNNLRVLLIEQQRALEPQEVYAASQQITSKLLKGVDWAAVKSAHIYQSVPAWNEIDTKLLIEKLRAEQPHLKIEVGAVTKDTPIPTAKFDLIIVPVLGFDSDNHRLGLGGGWYDRFLASQPRALKIGLAYKEGFIKGGLPHEPHDIPLNQIISA